MSDLPHCISREPDKRIIQQSHGGKQLEFFVQLRCTCRSALSNPTRALVVQSLTYQSNRMPLQLRPHDAHLYQHKAPWHGTLRAPKWPAPNHWCSRTLFAANTTYSSIDHSWNLHLDSDRVFCPWKQKSEVNSVIGCHMASEVRPNHWGSIGSTCLIPKYFQYRSRRSVALSSSGGLEMVRLKNMHKHKLNLQWTISIQEWSSAVCKKTGPLHWDWPTTQISLELWRVCHRQQSSILWTNRQLCRICQCEESSNGTERAIH